MSTTHDSREAILAAAAGMNFLQRHIDSYVDSEGREGHIISLAPFGGPEFAPTLLLGTTGRKSGELRLIPLSYGLCGKDWIVMGSNAGAVADPAWVLNIRSNAKVRFQVATQAFYGDARILENDERKVVWNYMRTTTPSVARFEKLSREVPLVALSPLENAPLFSRDPADPQRIR